MVKDKKKQVQAIGLYVNVQLAQPNRGISQVSPSLSLFLCLSVCQCVCVCVNLFVRACMHACARGREGGGERAFSCMNLRACSVAGERKDERLAFILSHYAIQESYIQPSLSD